MQKNKAIKMRVTTEEMTRLKEKAASYNSVSHYIRSAITEYSNIDAKRKLELMNELVSFYRTFRNELSWVGGNLNQSTKRANELAAAGLLPSEYISEVLMPVIQDTRNMVSRLQKELDKVTRKAVKL